MYYKKRQARTTGRKQESGQNPSGINAGIDANTAAGAKAIATNHGRFVDKTSGHGGTFGQ